MKKVLYISYDGMTDPLGQAQVLPYLVELSKKGYKIYLLSTEKKNIFHQHQAQIQAIVQAHGIHWEYIFYRKKPPIISTLLDVNELWRKALKLHLKEKIEFTHARSYIAALVSLGLKKRLKIPFIFDMRGFWADERVDGKLWDKNKFPFSWVYRYFKNKEKEFLQEAQEVVALTYAAKKEMDTWALPNIAPISVIPCCADLYHFNYQSITQQMRAQKRIALGVAEDEFLLGYLGAIGTWYLVEEMLCYFKVLSKHKKAKFLWITKEDTRLIAQLCEQLDIGMDQMIILSSERKDLPLLISALDASIFFILPTYSKKASSPTKQAELLGMGIPLICNSGVGDTEEILKHEGAALVINQLNEEAFEQSMSELDTLLKKDPSFFRDIAHKYFSLENGAQQYAQLYAKINI